MSTTSKRIQEGMELRGLKRAGSSLRRLELARAR